MGRLPARPSARRSTTTPRRGTFARWSSTAASAASTTPCCAPGRAPRWSQPSTSTRTATTHTSTTLEFARPRRTYTGCRCRRSISSTAASGCSRRRASRSRVKATGRTKTTDALNRSFDCWKRSCQSSETRRRICWWRTSWGSNAPRRATRPCGRCTTSGTTRGSSCVARGCSACLTAGRGTFSWRRRKQSGGRTGTGTKWTNTRRGTRDLKYGNHVYTDASHPRGSARRRSGYRPV